ncbi:MAG: hypothetical protein JJ916_01185 [Phycisphaerales bacterium]|nr:hypothetical protein [Phycisphaerales bacterium]
MMNRMIRSLATILASTAAPLALTSPAGTAAAQTSFDCQPPQILATLDGLTNPMAITIEDNYAYIIEDYDFFTIVDLSDPTNPTVIGHTDLYAFSAESITIIGEAAYLHGNSGEIAIYNIEDKTDPWFRRFYGGLYGSDNLLPRTDSHVFLKDSYALNIERPLAPGVDEYEQTNTPFDEQPFFVQGDVLITQSSSRYDISDPLNPTLIGDLGYIDLVASNRYDHPYVIAQNTGELLSTRIDDHTPVIFTIESPIPSYQDATVRADLIFAANGTIDVYTSGSNPQLIASFMLHDTFYAQHIRQLGDSFVVLSDEQLAIVKIPTNPLSSARTTSSQTYLTKHNNLLITSSETFAKQSYSVNLIDTTEPLRPQWIAQLPFDTQLPRSRGADAIGNTLFVAERSTGLNAFDISDPSAPIPLGTYPTNTDPKVPSFTADIAISADLAYVTDQQAGLLVYQIQPDTSLTPISNLPIDASVRNIFLMDDLAMVTSGSDAYLIDLTDPFNPQHLSTIAGMAPSGVPSIPAAHRDGDLLYTAENDHGYRIFDITNPTDPIELAHFDADVSTPQGDFEAYVYDILVEGNTLYVAMSSGGFAIYDNTNIFAPTLLAHLPSAVPQAGSITRYREFVKEGNLIYIASGDTGARVLSLDGCTIPCAIDYNNDGALDFFDVTAFITAFNDMNPSADINNDNEFNFFDITAFIVAYQNGCP